MANKTIIQVLRDKVDQLIDDNRRLRDNVKRITAERDRAQAARRDAEMKIAQLEKRVNLLETTGALGGTRADNRAARMRVNKLLREIDSCIAMMNK